MSEIAQLRAEVAELRQKIEPRRKPSNGNPHVIFRMHRDDRAALERIAADQNRPVSEIIRQALGPVIHPAGGKLIELKPVPSAFVPRLQTPRKQGDDADRAEIAESIAAKVALTRADAAAHAPRITSVNDGQPSHSEPVPIVLNAGAETVPKASRKPSGAFKER